MHVTLLHNPNAGRGKATADDLIGLIRKAGYDVTYVSIKGDYKTALRTPGDFIAIAGGDGTVEKVGRRMAGAGVLLAILPLGTANNIANALDIRGSLREIVNGWKTARRRSFDVGIAKGPWGERRFLEGVGLGPIPIGMKAFQKKEYARAPSSKKLHHASRTMREIIEKHPAHPYEIRLDGRDMSGSYVFVAAMNIGALGPQVAVPPEADPSDGLFHLVLIDASHREALLASASSRGNRRLGTSKLTFPLGRHIQITWSGAPLHIDDEIWPYENHDYASVNNVTADIRIEPGALEFLVPGTIRGER